MSRSAKKNAQPGGCVLPKPEVKRNQEVAYDRSNREDGRAARTARPRVVRDRGREAIRDLVRRRARRVVRCRQDAERAYPADAGRRRDREDAAEVRRYG